MHIQVFPSDEAMAAAAADWLVSIVRQQPAALLCLAAGDTQRLTFARVAAISQAAAVDFRSVRFVGLDEWAGLAASYPGSCRHFLQSQFFGPLGIAPGQITFFDAVAADLAGECQRLDHYLDTQGPIDGLLLGVGRNGHLGMNEPGCDPAARSQVVALTAQTRLVGQKYFSAQRMPLLERGITLGLADLLQSRQILLQASGPAKAAIMAEVIHGPVTPAVPASLLRNCQQAICYLDAAAAAHL